MDTCRRRGRSRRLAHTDHSQQRTSCPAPRPASGRPQPDVRTRPKRHAGRNRLSRWRTEFHRRRRHRLLHPQPRLHRTAQGRFRIRLRLTTSHRRADRGLRPCPDVRASRRRAGNGDILRRGRRHRPRDSCSRNGHRIEHGTDNFRRVSSRLRALVRHQRRHPCSGLDPARPERHGRRSAGSGRPRRTTQCLDRNAHRDARIPRGTGRAGIHGLDDQSARK